MAMGNARPVTAGTLRNTVRVTFEGKSSMHFEQTIEALFWRQQTRNNETRVEFYELTLFANLSMNFIISIHGRIKKYT